MGLPSPWRSRCWAAGGALGLLLLSGCKSSAERELKAEVQRLALAINALRDAPNNRKQEPLKALEAAPCAAPGACELKQVCVQGYALHTKAIEATSRVREALRQQKSPAAAGALLQVSEGHLTRSKKLIARCTSLQGELLRETR